MPLGSRMSREPRLEDRHRKRVRASPCRSTVDSRLSDCPQQLRYLGWPGSWQDSWWTSALGLLCVRWRYGCRKWAASTRERERASCATRRARASILRAHRLLRHRCRRRAGTSGLPPRPDDVLRRRRKPTSLSHTGTLGAKSVVGLIVAPEAHVGVE